MNVTPRTAQKLVTGAAVFGVSAIGGGAAHAAIVTITDTISIGALETAGGGTLSGTFNINGLLAAGLNEPYNILSATMTGFGFSDINYSGPVASNYTGYQYNGGYSYTYYISVPYTYSYSCGWGCTNYATGYYSVAQPGYVNSYLQSHDVIYTDNVADQLTISAAGTSATGTASTSYNATGDYGGESYTSSSSGSDYVNYNYDRQRDVYYAIYGETDITTALGAGALAALSSTGLLDYSVSVPTGQVTVNSVQLSVTYDNTPIPEPASVAALVAGIGGLAAWGRRRKVRKTIH
jgi:hypothetical protein